MEIPQSRRTSRFQVKDGDELLSEHNEFDKAQNSAGKYCALRNKPIQIIGANYTVSMEFFEGLPRTTEIQGLAANRIFVDKTLGANITDGSYSIANRNNSGTDGNAYTTIQAAITALTTGYTLYMRGGTYFEVNIDIPESLNGTSWTDGNYSVIRSYPGEWAIVDATGLQMGNPYYDAAVFTHPNGYDQGSPTGYNEYLIFRNFEVLGGKYGFFLKMRNCRFRYMYIHDNQRYYNDGLAGGILSSCPQYLDIKYCWIKDNHDLDANNKNNSGILLDGDYKDNAGEGDAWVANASTHHNEIAYNYIQDNKGSTGIKQKNQQRFGLNSRNPTDMTYATYGDKIHHNIILMTSPSSGAEAIGSGQDFVQIYNNITNATINLGRLAAVDADNPQMYNHMAYNNTVIRNPSYVSSYGGIATHSGYNPAKNNYYDALPQRTVHEHVWLYNNIIDKCFGSGYDFTPILMHWSMPQDTTNPDQDNADMVIERNLIHDNTANHTYSIGHNTNATDETKQWVSNSELNSYSDTWRSLTPGTVINWENTTASLWKGASGADQYKANGSFVAGGSYTVANGGKGGNHPYLAGVTIPSYLGAVDPAGGAWVDGILDNVGSVAWLQAQTGDADPSWVE